MGCNNTSGSNFSAIRLPVQRPQPQPPLFVPQNQPPAVPTIPVITRGGRGGTPHSPGAAAPSSGGSAGGGDTDIAAHTVPSNPQPVTTQPTSTDPRDGGRRLDDPTCDSFRALSGGWTVKVDENWDYLNKENNRWIKEKIEREAPGFFSDSLCQGLQILHGMNGNPGLNDKVAKQIQLKIGAKKLHIVLSSDAEIGEYDKHQHKWFLILPIAHGEQQIKLGRRVMEGVVAALFSQDIAVRLAPKDSMLTDAKPADMLDILDNQIQAAKAGFFHYVMHMAGADIDKKKHTSDSFAQHQKELDVIDACTAQVFPYFYIDADGTDFQGKTETGPYFKNSNLACLVCTTADTYTSGMIFATIRSAADAAYASPKAQDACSGIPMDTNGHDQNAIVTPDRSANLYEEMK